MIGQAKLHARGRIELLRMEKRIVLSSEDKYRIEWAKNITVFLSDKVCLTNRQVGYLPSHNARYNRIYSFGWRKKGEYMSVSEEMTKYLEKGWEVSSSREDIGHRVIRITEIKK